MEWCIRIKTGMFKTQTYLLTIESRKIILNPKAEGVKKIMLADHEIVSITIIKKTANTHEIELDTKQGIYYGVLSKRTDLSELFRVLSENFGNRVSII